MIYKHYKWLIHNGKWLVHNGYSVMEIPIYKKKKKTHLDGISMTGGSPKWLVDFMENPII